MSSKAQQKIVRGGNGVHIAGKVKIDILHREHLRITASRGASLDTEHRTQ